MRRSLMTVELPDMLIDYMADGNWHLPLVRRRHSDSSQRHTRHLTNILFSSAYCLGLVVAS
jgi:hypothetical protein